MRRLRWPDRVARKKFDPLSNEGQMPAYRYGVVLLLLLVTFVVMSWIEVGKWGAVLTALLQGLTLFVVLTAAGARPRTYRVVAIVVAACVLAIIAATPSDSDNARALAFGLNALLVGIAPVMIVRSLVRRHVVDIQTVAGAICIYVLLGMLAAFVYTTIGTLTSEPFFVQTSHATSADYLYFSFVTLTTTGYGDYTAATSLGRPLAVLEALIGQIYLVTVVALIVSQLRPNRRLVATPEQGEDANA